MRPTFASRLARLLVTLVLVAPYVPVTTVRAAAACGDVQVVWARGSNRTIGDFDWDTFVNVDLAPRVGADVSLSSYQLGQDGGFGGFAYPATGDLSALVDAAFWLPGNPYDASVAQGRSELVAYLTDRAMVCPGEVFVLGGWSQGAQVVGEGL